MALANQTTLNGLLMDEQQVISLAELCNCCALPAEQVMIMVEYGIVEPSNGRITSTRLQFPSHSVLRIKTAVRLQRDLGVNLEGAALALELLDELKTLRQQVASLQRSAMVWDA